MRIQVVVAVKIQYRSYK